METGLWPAGYLRSDDRARFAHYDQWRALTRKIASYVYAGPVRFSVSPFGADDAVATRAEQLLGQVIKANGLDQLDLDLCIAASVLGDAAVKVTWDARTARPAVVAVDPAGLTVWTAGDDPRRVERLAHGYWLTGEQLEPVLGARLESWQAGKRYRVIETWTDARWSIAVDGSVVQDGPNPYGWIPYVIAVNNPRSDHFWGESDLIDLADVCRELNGRMSVLSRVLELSGAPITVLENVDGSEGITVGPGAKWELPEGAKAYLLDLLQGGGVRLHVEYIDLLYRALHDLSETPRTAFGDSAGSISVACGRRRRSGRASCPAMSTVPSATRSRWSRAVSRAGGRHMRRSVEPTRTRNSRAWMTKGDQPRRKRSPLPVSGMWHRPWNVAPVPPCRALAHRAMKVLPIDRSRDLKPGADNCTHQPGSSDPGIDAAFRREGRSASRSKTP